MGLAPARRPPPQQVVFVSPLVLALLLLLPRALALVLMQGLP